MTLSRQETSLYVLEYGKKCHTGKALTTSANSTLELDYHKRPLQSYIADELALEGHSLCISSQKYNFKP